jgi:hypothetical protein
LADCDSAPGIRNASLVGPDHATAAPAAANTNANQATTTRRRRLIAPAATLNRISATDDLPNRAVHQNLPIRFVHCTIHRK